MRTISCVALLVSAIATSPLLAQETPAQGTAFGALDKDFLEFSCVRASVNQVNCEFVQVKIRMQADQADLEKELQSIDEKLQDLVKSPMPREECNKFALIEAALKTGQAPKSAELQEFSKQLEVMSPIERRDSYEQVAAFRQLCDRPNRETLLSAIRADHSKKSRTCKIWTNRYSESFSKQGNGDVWTSTSGPSGECGVVSVSTLERAGNKFSFWNYRTKKIVTNKAGSSALGMKCTMLDEREYEYKWQTRDFYRGCDYIGYGLF